MGASVLREEVASRLGVVGQRSSQRETRSGRRPRWPSAAWRSARSDVPGRPAGRAPRTPAAPPTSAPSAWAVVTCGGNVRSGHLDRRTHRSAERRARASAVPARRGRRRRSPAAATGPVVVEDQGRVDGEPFERQRQRGRRPDATSTHPPRTSAATFSLVSQSCSRSVAWLHHAPVRPTSVRLVDGARDVHGDTGVGRPERGRVASPPRECERAGPQLRSAFACSRSLELGPASVLRPARPRRSPRVHPCRETSPGRRRRQPEPRRGRPATSSRTHTARHADAVPYSLALDGVHERPCVGHRPAPRSPSACRCAPSTPGRASRLGTTPPAMVRDDTRSLWLPTASMTTGVSSDRARHA